MNQMNLTKEKILKQVDTLSAKDLAEYIRREVVSLEELQKTGELDASKRKEINKILDVYKKEDADKIEKKKAEIEAENRASTKNAELEYIINNNHKYTPDMIKKTFESDENSLRDLCGRLDISLDLIKNYTGTEDWGSSKNNTVPKTLEEIPTGFTDVFFWGTSSSGKSCALSAILSTINTGNPYTITNPKIRIKYGKAYLEKLKELPVGGGGGLLPPPTLSDMTQYMPFRLQKDGEKRARNISFVELSGELFECFNQIQEVYNGIVPDEYLREGHEFAKLNLLLKSDNPKIHFFLIDYCATPDIQQKKKLQDAAEYFEQADNIFREKTTAVYIILTKADKIEPRSGKTREEEAQEFLNNHFGNFVKLIKRKCGENEIKTSEPRIFSIGQVYFNRICKLDRIYADKIIDDLFAVVKPPQINVWAWLFKLLSQ